MRTEADLAELIHSRICSGRLPSAAGHRLFGGQGDGSLCACCDRFITTSEMQFDVACPVPGGLYVPLPMHLSCFEAWVNESRAMARFRDESARRPAGSSFSGA